MERQEIDELLKKFEVLLSPKIETFVDYLDLCPLANLLKFQECVNELVDAKKNGIQTPELKYKEWYVDESTKYLDLEKEYRDLEEKYLDLEKEYRDSEEKWYVYESTKYLDLEKEYRDLEEKYLDLKKEYQATPLSYYQPDRWRSECLALTEKYQATLDDAKHWQSQYLALTEKYQAALDDTKHWQSQYLVLLETKTELQGEFLPDVLG